RNALLRAGEEPALVSAWNEGLVRAGSRLVAARRRWVAEHAAAFAGRVHEIAGGGEAVLAYDPSLPLSADDTGEESIAARFADELARVGERERRRGTTLVGPHLDDLQLRGRSSPDAAWADLRAFG